MTTNSNTSGVDISHVGRGLRAYGPHHAANPGRFVGFGLAGWGFSNRGPSGRSGDRWLTRDEAAALIRHCWRYREKQTVHSGRGKGRAVFTAKRPLRHVARFILIGIYTGTRASAIATASPYPEQGRSFVDLERGIFYRKQIGKRATKKLQTPAPVPPRLLAHMRR